MVQNSQKNICIACSIFKNELEYLRRKGKIDFPVFYLDSALHIHPDKLNRQLDVLLKEKGGRQDKKVLLLYGDCHAYMDLQESLPNVQRVKGVNCIEILLGTEKYRKLNKLRVFFLMPEWTIRWREIFERELGLKGETAKSFMQEMHTKLLYLDTKQIPVPAKELEEIADYTGLNVDIITIAAENILTPLQNAIKRFKNDNK